MSKKSDKVNVALKFDDKVFKKALRGSDWDSHFDALSQLFQKRTNLVIGQDCYMTVDGNAILSASQLQSNVSNKSNVDIIVVKGAMPVTTSKNVPKCVIVSQGKQYEWEMDISDKDDIDVSMFQEFCDFLEDKIGITIEDINDMPSNVEIFCIDDENDTKNDSMQVETAADFIELFEDIDFEDDSVSKRFYFFVRDTNEDNEKQNEKVENEDSKSNEVSIVILIDLSNVNECEENSINVKVEANLDQSKDKWNESWDLVTNEIGEAIEDAKWESKYDIVYMIENDSNSSNNTIEIETVTQFMSLIKNNKINERIKLTVQPREKEVPIEDKLFIFECDGNNASYKPSKQYTKDKSKVMNKVIYTLKRSFDGIKTNDLKIFYSQKQNTIKMDENDELTQDTIDTFWNALCENKTVAAMYFKIGDKDEADNGSLSGINSKQDYYFSITFENKTLEWSPNPLNDCNWEIQWDKLVSDVCSYFHLEKNDNFAFMTKKTNVHIENADDVENVWDEEVIDVDEKCVELTMVNPKKSVKAAQAAPAQAAPAQAEAALAPAQEETSSVHVGSSIHIVPSNNEKKDENNESKEQVVDNFAQLKKKENELRMVDNGILETKITNSIETDLETLFDNIDRRQELVMYMKELMASSKNESQRIEIEASDAVSNAVLNHFDKLMELMKDEGYQDTHLTMISLFNGKNGIKQYNWEIARKELKKSMDEVRPFNIKDMLSLHKKTDDAAKQVVGQDIVLLLGHTGAGKSTTIHFLGGSKMAKVSNTGHIAPIEIASKQLEKIETEEKATQSVTRYISAAPMSLFEAGIKLMGRNKKDVVFLCDSPGFDDTSGAEVDVANGLGIVKAIRKAKSVRILLIIGYSAFDSRMRGLKSLTHTLSKIMPQFDKYLACICPIFTKTPRSSKDEIRFKCEKALDEMVKAGDDNDEALNDLLAHLASLIDPIILNPIESDRGQVLKQIFGSNAKWIQSPAEAFEAFVTETSRERIKRQLLKHESVIGKAIKECHYNVITTKLMELVQLNAVVPDQATKNCISNCIKAVSKAWNSKCNKAMKTIDTSARTRGLDEFITDLGSYCKLLDESKDCKTFQDAFCNISLNEDENSEVNDDFTLIEAINEEEDEKMGMQNSSNVKNEKNLIDEMIDAQLLEKELNNAFNFLLNQCSLDANSKIYFNKCQAVVDQLGGAFEQKYHSKVGDLWENIQDIIIQTKKMIDGLTDVEKIYQNLASLVNLAQLSDEFERYDKSIDCSKVSDILPQYLISQLKEKEMLLSSLFSPKQGLEGTDPGSGMKFNSIGISQSENAITECDKVLKAIKECVDTFGVPIDGMKNKLGKEIKKIYEECLNCVVEYLRVSMQEFKSTLEESGNNKYGNVSNDELNDTSKSENEYVKSFVKQMCKIREINKDIESKTSEIYYQTLQNIIGYLENMRRVFSDSVNDIESNKSNIDYGKLVSCVAILRNYNWVFALKNGSSIEDCINNNMSDDMNSNEVLDAIEDILTKHCIKLFERADDLYIDLNVPDSVMEAKEILDSLSGLKEVQKLIPGIGDSLNNIGIRIQISVRTVLKKIQKEFVKPMAIPAETPIEENDKEKKESKENNDESKQVKLMQSLFPKLNAQKAANSIDFVSKCGKIKWYSPARSSKEVKKKMLDAETKDNSEMKEDGNANDFDHINDEMAKEMEQEMNDIAIKEEIQNTFDNLKQYLAAYGNYRQSEMNECLDYLVNIDSATAALYANIRAMTLSNDLKELTKIEEKQPNLMIYLGDENLLSEWPNKFEEEFVDIQAALQRLAACSDPRLQIGVIHARALGKIDWFLKEYGKNKDNMFKPLFTEYQAKVDPSPQMKEFQESLEKDQFMEVQSQLVRMQSAVDVAIKTSSGDLKSLKRSFVNARKTLHHKLVSKAESIRMDVVNIGIRDDEKLDREKLRDLQKALNSMTDAISYCQEFIEKSDLQDIDATRQEAKRLIVEDAKMIAQSATAALESNYFETINAYLEKIQVIVDILGPAFAKMDSKDENTNKQMSDIKKNVKKELNDKLNKIKNNFLKNISLTNRDHNPYESNDTSPKKLYEQLAVVMKTNAEYKKLWDVIEKDLKEKFREEMKRIDGLEFSKCMNATRVLEQALECMPSEVKSYLERDFIHFNNNLKEKIGLECATQLIESNDFEALNDVYYQYKRSNATANANKVKKMLTDQFYKRGAAMVDSLQQSINKNNIQNMGAVLDNIYKGCMLFGTMPRANGPYQPPSADLIKCFHNVIASLTNIHHAKVKAIVKILKQVKYSDDVIAVLNESIMLIRSMSEYEVPTTNNKWPGEVMAFDKTYLRKEHKYIEDSVRTYFANLDTNFEKAMKANDMTLLNHVLNCKKICEKSSQCRLIEDMSRMGCKIEIGKSYEKLIEQIDTMLSEIQAELSKFDFEKSNNFQSQGERIMFYESIQNKLNLLSKSSEIKEHLKKDIKSEYVDPTKSKIEKSIKKLCQQTISLINDDLASENDASKIDKKVLQSINDKYCTLESIKECNITNDKESMSDVENACKQVSKTVKQYIRKEQNVALAAASDAQKLAPHLANLEKMKTVLHAFEDASGDAIDKCLDKFKKSNAKQIGALMQLLEIDDSGWGGHLVSEHQLFKGESNAKFVQALKEDTIDLVIEKIECNDKSIDKEILKTRYNEFDKMYKKLINENLRPNIHLQLAPLASNAERIGRDCRDKMVASKGWPLIGWGKKGMWNPAFKQNTIELLANVFAIWTLKHCEHYFSNGGHSGFNESKSDDNAYLKMPRVAQVVSIIRILSIDTKDETIVNNLIQIGTGEGKSVTLAITACILALLGFEASCACYSQYLSERDYQEFESLFETLRVKDYIHYGTFNQICENIINKKGNIREMTENMILSKNKNKKNDKSKRKVVTRKHILLIDEIDVFFNKEFYGNIYTSGATIRHGCIKKISDLIWQDHEKNGTAQEWKLNLAAIKQEAAYGELQKEFGNWTSLLNEAIKDMLVDVRQCVRGKTSYVIKDGKIGYKDGDSISTTKVMGYQTMFTYYLEKDKVNQRSFDESIAIYIKCGNFSYAEIPNNENFVSILGVTGTLRQLSPAEQKIMKDNYDISRHTYMPSLFGDRRLSFDNRKKSGIMVYDDDHYFENLRNEIDKRMHDRGNDKPRCVFVAFESRQHMKEFEKSSAFDILKHNTLILSEELNEKEKKSVVRQATMSKQVTLLTRIFGRGTDFQVKDAIVKNNGGPHVIQTFLSKQLSEEVQIMGRTARQGGDGSYSMVLKESELKWFGIEKKEIEDVPDTEIYELLDKKREAKFEEDYEDDTKGVIDAKSRHDVAIKLRDELAKDVNTQDEIKIRNILIDLNRGASIGAKKIAILMDATGSMSQLLSQAKNRVQQMFDRICVILKDRKMDEKSFQLKFIAYRSYSAIQSDLLLQESTWSTDSVALKKFLDTVDARFGQGAEALEVALQKVNKMIIEDGDVIENVLIIGDAPPTATLEHVKSYRNKMNGVYNWDQSDDFATPTHYKIETEKLKQNEVALNTYYLDDWAKSAFLEMARETGGQCEYLDVHSENNETLTDVVSCIVLQSCDKSGKCVKDYKARFMHI